jgi:hypothetical protein
VEKGKQNVQRHPVRTELLARSRSLRWVPELEGRGVLDAELREGLSSETFGEPGELARAEGKRRKFRSPSGKSPVRPGSRCRRRSAPLPLPSSHSATASQSQHTPVEGFCSTSSRQPLLLLERGRGRHARAGHTFVLSSQGGQDDGHGVVARLGDEFVVLRCVECEETILALAPGSPLFSRSSGECESGEESRTGEQGGETHR